MRYLLIGLFVFVSYTLLTPGSSEVMAFIHSLDKQQAAKTLHPFDDEKRTDWHFLPAASYPRAGITLGELNVKQRELVHKLLQSDLSVSGYEKTKAIIALENILAEMEKNNPSRTPDQYALAIFGNPQKDDEWAWSFGGHHISLHFTYVDGKVSMSPRFFGSNPGEVRQGPQKGLRVLAAEEDLGFELLNALSPNQREKAIISEEPYMEIVTTNQAKVDPLEKAGISENELTVKQRDKLMEIISEYLSCLPQEMAGKRMKAVEEEEKTFAWVGATTMGKAHYYRIQGQTFLIEFDNAQNNANHVHTVWRDFDGDFGRDLINEHRMQHKH